MEGPCRAAESASSAPRRQDVGPGGAAAAASGAVEPVRGASRLDPRDAEPMLELALLLRSQQRHDQADALLFRIRGLDPDDPGTSTPSPSRSEWKVSSTRPWPTLTPQFRWTASSARLMPGSALPVPDEALRPGVEAMERALELDPELPDAGSLHLFIGRSWQELGDPSAAVDYFWHRATRRRTTPPNGSVVAHSHGAFIPP